MGGSILTILKNASEPPPKETVTNLNFLPSNLLPREKEFESPTEETKLIQKQFIKEKRIIILDTVFSKSYIPSFDGLKLKEKPLIPTVVHLQRGSGGGGIDFFLGLFNDSTSNLYFPKIVVDISVNLLASGIISLITKIYKRFRKTNKKRQQIIYSTEHTMEYYEFSSNITEDEFVCGIKDIPSNSKRVKKNGYFVRDRKNGKWIEEDIN